MDPTTTIENRLGRWHKSFARGAVKHPADVRERRTIRSNRSKEEEEEEAVSLETSATDRYRYRNPGTNDQESERNPPVHVSSNAIPTGISLSLDNRRPADSRRRAN